MQPHTQKLGFWPVFALVTGSQISSGVFILPTTLAPFGTYTFLGWFVAGLGALALAFVFAQLCNRFPETGGPHIYVQRVFGDLPAFFVGWTYWIISWISTTVVFAACVGYLRPVFGIESPQIYFLLQVALLVAVTLLNLYNAHIACKAEFFLTVLKFIPLLILPALVLPYFDWSHLVMSTEVQQLSPFSALSRIVLLTFWGFIGLETATAPAGLVANPGKTIPLALLCGTACVMLIYLFNSFGIMGAVPGALLAASEAPYVDAAQIALGGSWHIWIAIISSIVCLSTLNAWTLTSGQIAFGLGRAKLFPSLFASQTKDGTPWWGLIISSLAITPILALLSNKSLHQQIATIIDISVISFLFVYATCCVALFVALKREKQIRSAASIIALIALLFCAWIISQASSQTLITALLFTLSGAPFYWWWHHKP